MIGAIAGDIIGSAYEYYSVKSTDFKLFTTHLLYRSGPYGTVPELLFEKKQLIQSLQQLLVSYQT